MRIKVIKQKKTNDTIRFSDLEIGKLYKYTLTESLGDLQWGIVFVSCHYHRDVPFLVTELVGEDEGYTWDENEIVKSASKFTLLTDTLQLTND
jgi:hypothetical protein